MMTEKLVTAILYIAIGICILSAGKEVYRRMTAMKEYEELEEMIPADHVERDLCVAEKKKTDSANGLSADRRFREINPDYIGILSVPALGIRYPVVQGEDNEEYLHTTFEGKSNPSGCIFLDCGNDPRMTDDISYIYGHNMKDGTMFGSLKRLKTEKWKREDVKAYFFNDDKTLTYEFAGADVVKTYSMKDEACKGKNLVLYTCWGGDRDSRLLATFRACS